jgi:hypothetical protein
MNGKRPATVYYCPDCGAEVRWAGFYQCMGDGCGRQVEMGQLATAEDAKRIRAGRSEEVPCDALF